MKMRPPGPLARALSLERQVLHHRWSQLRESSGGYQSAVPIEQGVYPTAEPARQGGPVALIKPGHPKGVGTVRVARDTNPVQLSLVHDCDGGV
jgi:hypothetical protein